MEPIITVENLSKCYPLTTTSERMGNLRDVLASVYKAPLRALRMRNSTEGKQNTQFWALRDVSFHVDEGDIVAVIGSNGAGKSTLLKILSRITEPTTGCVRLRGRLASLLEVGTGFHPELTGRENIFLNGAILGMRKSEIRARFDEIVDFAEIEMFLETPVKRYSSGMYIRLGFAVAAHLNPDILVVDEVLAVGDTAFQKKCLGKMSEVSRQGRTVIFVSHNMAAVENLCRKAVVLDHGQKAFEGSTREAIDFYAHGMGGGPAERSGAVNLWDLRRPSGFLPYLSSLELLTKGDQPVLGGINVGAALKLRVTFVLSQPADNIDVGIGFDSLLGGRICTVSTIFDAAKYSGRMAGAHTYDCEISSLPLIPGEYSLSCAFSIKNRNVDYVVDVARLTVLASDFYGTGHLPSSGVFVIEQRWSAYRSDPEVIEAASKA